MDHTIREERAHALTHGAGALLGALGLAWLVVLAAGHGDPWRVVSVSVYGASLVALFTASAAYHSARHPDTRRLLRIVDHASIYLLIAGSYTPFTLVTLRGPWGWSLFGVVWGAAALGVAAKTVFTGRYEALSIALYVLMGWSGVVAALPLIERLPEGGLPWLVAGGLAYTGGVVFYAWERLPYNHLWWHLAVLAGAACHFFAVLSLVR